MEIKNLSPSGAFLTATYNRKRKWKHSFKYKTTYSLMWALRAIGSLKTCSNLVLREKVKIDFKLRQALDPPDISASARPRSRRQVRIFHRHRRHLRPRRRRSRQRRAQQRHRARQRSWKPPARTFAVFRRLLTDHFLVSGILFKPAALAFSFVFNGVKWISIPFSLSDYNFHSPVLAFPLLLLTTCSQCYEAFAGLYLQVCKYRTIFNVFCSHKYCLISYVNGCFHF